MCSTKLFKEFDPHKSFHPVDFIKQFKIAFARIYNEAEKIDIFCVRHMTGGARTWGNRVLDQYTTFTDSENAFLNKYWSREKQQSIKETILSMSSYDQSSGSMRDFLQKYWERNGYLDRPVSEDYLITLLIKHLLRRIRRQLAMKTYDNFDELLRVVDRLEEIDNEESQARPGQNANPIKIFQLNESSQSNSKWYSQCNQQMIGLIETGIIITEGIGGQTMRDTTRTRTGETKVRIGENMIIRGGVIMMSDTVIARDLRKTKKSFGWDPLRN